MSNTDGLTANIAIGNRIDIKFTQELKGDATGYDPYPLNAGPAFNPTGVATASSQYSSSCAASYAFNGVDEPHWETASGVSSAWLQIDLGVSTWIAGFGWRTYSSYYAKVYNISGSDDGSTWSVIYNGTQSASLSSFTNIATWTPVKYRYYRWNFTTLNTTSMAIYRIQLLSCSGNEGAFHITGSEYQYVGGPLITKNYTLTNCDIRYNDVICNIDTTSGLLLNTTLDTSNNIKLGRA